MKTAEQMCRDWESKINNMDAQPAEVKDLMRTSFYSGAVEMFNFFISDEFHSMSQPEVEEWMTRFQAETAVYFDLIVNKNKIHLN